LRGDPPKDYNKIETSRFVQLFDDGPFQSSSQKSYKNRSKKSHKSVAIDDEVIVHEYKEVGDNTAEAENLVQDDSVQTNLHVNPGDDKPKVTFTVN
jgi:hypothetical protein